MGDFIVIWSRLCFLRVANGFTWRGRGDVLLMKGRDEEMLVTVRCLFVICVTVALCTRTRLVLTLALLVPSSLPPTQAHRISSLRSFPSPLTSPKALVNFKTLAHANQPLESETDDAHPASAVPGIAATWRSRRGIAARCRSCQISLRRPLPESIDVSGPNSRQPETG